MNRLQKLFAENRRPLLSIYFTAGFPHLDDTLKIAAELEAAGADFLEIGFPYSDPLADGPVIQASSQQALENGMSLKILFEQLRELREKVHIPVLLMGYLNPVMQYGIERFCSDAAAVGVDGCIIPDLPLSEYENRYRQLFEQHNLSNIFLVTPQTSEERIRRIDSLSKGFIYLLSSSATTGQDIAANTSMESYLSRIRAMQLKNPTMVGFGIADRSAFQRATAYADGAIVGTAFIRLLSEPDALQRIRPFVADLAG